MLWGMSVDIESDGATPKSWWIATLVIFTLSLLFWWPALFQGKMVIHGETVHFDLPMMALQSQLGAGSGILWNNTLYGGFPLFAEGQAGFASPVKMVLALLFDPVSAMMAYHFCATFFGCLGILLLARAVRISPLSGLFASVAGGFSIQWIFYHNNMVCAGTIAVVPWVLLSCEHWLRHTNLASVLSLSITAALMVLSGYPMFIHGVALYIFLRVATEFFYRDGRAAIWAKRRRLLTTGFASALLALGLCAVQLLPLLELVSESHRVGGITLLFPAHMSWLAKGFFFSYISTDGIADVGHNIPSVGSSLVCLLFLAGCFFLLAGLSRDGSRIMVAHAVSALFILNLGVQEASPVFRFVYQHHLIPGLHFFRYMPPYLVIVIVGVALVAGAALDALSGRAPLKLLGDLQSRHWWVVSAFLFSSILVFVASRQVYVSQYGIKQLLPAVVAVLVYLFLLMQKQQRQFAYIAVGLLIVEAIVFRFGVFHLAERKLLVEPAQARIVKSDLGYSPSWRVKDLTSASAFGFLPPDSPGLEGGFTGMMSSLTPMASLLWQISTIDSVSSLGLHRRYLIEQPMADEFMERTGTPGTRIIDVLGVRYFTAESGLNLKHAKSIYEVSGEWGVYQNEQAMPHFQLYTSARAFASPEAVLVNWSDRKSNELFVESDAVVAPLNAPISALAASSWQIVTASPSRSVLNVNAVAPLWLFMADADYPGWRVYINGESARHYSAQILGKAVPIPVGNNRVEFVFRPLSFYLSLCISLFSVLIVSGLLVYIWRTRWQVQKGRITIERQ